MMRRSKTGIPSIRTSILMLAISMAMVGCGGGSGGNTGSNSGGTDGANDDGTSPQPVTCSETQYLQEPSRIHISEPTRPYSISYAVFCLKKKKKKKKIPVAFHNQTYQTVLKIYIDDLYQH